MKTMIRKHAIALLGMALLVAFTGFAARAYALDSPQTSTVDQQECDHDNGWFDADIDVCETQAP
jgi:hypothetical protein